MENAVISHRGTRRNNENSGKTAPYAVICADWQRVKIEERIASLPQTTRNVHIDGLPYLWIVEKIVTSLPELKVLRVTPTAERLFGDSHKAQLKEKAVCLEIGYHRPEYVWKDSDVRRKGYPKKSQWFKNLSSEQRELFQELLNLEDVEDARIVSRYFCLNGEPYIPTHEVGKLFGYSPTCACSRVSFKITSVHKFLDDAVEASQEVCEHVRVLRQKIEEARISKKAGREIEEEFEKERILLKTFLESFGVESLPAGIPPAEIATYCILHQLFWEGKLHGGLAKFKRGIRTLVLRYGLKGGGFRSYVSIGREVGRTGEAVRITEGRALRLLGIRVCHL